MTKTWDDVEARFKQFRDMKPRKQDESERTRLKMIGWLVTAKIQQVGEPAFVLSVCDDAASAMHTGEVFEMPAPVVAAAEPVVETKKAPARKRAKKAARKSA